MRIFGDCIKALDPKLDLIPELNEEIDYYEFYFVKLERRLKALEAAILQKDSQREKSLLEKIAELENFKKRVLECIGKDYDGDTFVVVDTKKLQENIKDEIVDWFKYGD